MQAHQHKVSFNGGIVSPPIAAARLDLEQASSRCRELQNFIPREGGAIYKRSGTEFLGRTKNSGPATLRPFNYSVNTRSQLEFGEKYVRFWNNRQRVYFDATGAQEWSGDQSSYEVGEMVSFGGILYIAKTNHTPEVANQPPSASWTTTSLLPWVVGTSYSVGDVVYLKQELAVCLVAHTGVSGDDSYPGGSDGNWAKLPKDNTWSTATPYQVGDVVGVESATTTKFYRCKLAHTSSASKKPGSGASWTTYWTDVSDLRVHSTASVSYVAGDLVRIGTDGYVCFESHTSDTDNAPTGSSPLWSPLTGMKAWTGTSTARAVGEWVIYGNQIFEITVAHTSTTYLLAGKFWEPGSSGEVNDNRHLPWSASLAYPIGRVVYEDGGTTLFYAVQEHTSDTDTNPTSSRGKTLWQRLNGISLWVTGASLVTGSYVVDSGVCYLVQETHVADSVAADLVAGNLLEAPYPLELATPYTLEEAKAMQAVGVNDLVWLLHEQHETKLLKRHSETVWGLSKIVWDWPPMRDPNTDEEITLTASATTGDNITLTASSNLFTPANVGSYFEVAHRSGTSTAKVTMAASGNSNVIRLLGRWDIFIYGTAWKGTVELQFSKDGSTNWLSQRTWEVVVANSRTISTFGTTEEEVFARLKFTRNATGGTSDYAVLEAADSRVTGLVEVVSFESPSIVKVNVVRDLQATTATTLWAESSYSDRRGWPRAATVHEQRLVLAGTESEPEKIRASAPDDFFNFRVTSNDDSALAFNAASRESNAVMWVESFGRVLAIGTLAEEWIASSGVDGKIMTGTNPPRMERETRSGSAPIPAQLLGDALLFVSNDRQQVLEFSYSLQHNKHVKVDMTQLAEHLFNSGIQQIAATRQPDAVLYCVMNDGRMLSFTYDREQNVVGWAEHVTDGLIESVSVVYGGQLNADEVWLVVNRPVDGEDQRFMEALDKETSRYRFEGDPEKLCYVDCSVLAEFEAPQTEVVGLDHLEGLAVTGLADGKVFTATVADGAITLATAASVVRIGLGYTSLYQGLWLDIPLQDGTAQDRKMRTARAMVTVYQSNGMESNPDPSDPSATWKPIPTLNATDVAARKVDPTKILFPSAGRHSLETNLSVRSSSPLPVNLLCITYVNETFGN